MATPDKVQAFISRFQWNQLPNISESELKEICDLRIEELPEDVVTDVVLNLSYLALNENGIGKLSLRTIDRLINKDESSRDQIVDSLIDSVQPLLLRTEVQRDVKRPGLRPSTGFSFKSDESRRKWKQNGEAKSIPLFYVILLHLRHRQLSGNLWWITPGILNLLDDTSDLVGIKLKGVLLLKTFLESVFQDEKHWISFEDTGLFKLYEPILKNMCYYMPPVHSAEECIRVWKEVFPTLDALYLLQFKGKPAEYRRRLGDFMSELILQQVMPRINMTSETLTIFVLETLKDQLQKLGETTLYYLSRVIYTLGEYLVRDPFVTSFEDILDRIIACLEVLLSVCPSDRVVAHKYDFLALIAILLHKCKQEGKLTVPLAGKLRELVRALEEKGCDFTDDKLELTRVKDVGELFSRD
ncbi:hypothetical protein HG536_0C06310 [Torulaspora globosa]|uniref:Uncharacterized protein n=1 Tax=Torulaspora globosa TaxID=48254 RepID=A0A7G3ZG26_9SACH|nr:uncharacterized protein HG536_0C06310 [Torulaspora globosa]QLL32462.1 hypothetical protein HG536_0C06310 [Torulaspora globosa]